VEAGDKRLPGMLLDWKLHVHMVKEEDKQPTATCHTDQAAPFLMHLQV